MRILYLFLSFFICSSLLSQDAQTILLESKEKCLEIKSGFYKMSIDKKYMTNKDTITTPYQCFFHKSSEDTIFSIFFNNVVPKKGGKGRHSLYTGSELVSYSASDSTGIIYSVDKWADYIQSIKHNFAFYTPFTNKNAIPLSKEEDFSDSLQHFELLGTEEILGSACYHIMNTSDFDKDEDENQMITPLSMETHYWISKKELIPLQYSIRYDVLMNQDTMVQYERVSLDSFSLNHLGTRDSVFALSTIPSYIKIEEYVEKERPELLEIGAQAPDGTVVSLDRDTLSLSDYRGNIVILDFFYKSCYPCLLAMPGLQKLHENYADRGLIVLGINPFDKPEEGLKKFLKNRNVSYPVVLSDRDLPKAYKVSAYPTLYVVDKTGKIIYQQMGYGEEAEEELEGFLLERL